jgi:putative ABC transport system permease protein
MLMDGGRAEQAITREGHPARPSAESPQVRHTAVTPGYFALLGISQRQGRGLLESDTADGKLVAVINETAARLYWRGEDPVGTRFALGSSERFGNFRQPPPGGIEWREVVGVVSDVRTGGYASEVLPEVFYNYRQFPLYSPTVLLRTSIEPGTAAGAVRQVIEKLNARIAITEMKTLEEAASESVRDQRERAGLVALFSAIALGLSMLGVHGVVSYTVSRRTQEIGIRLALGGRESQVSTLIIGRILVWVAAGLVVGLAGTYAIGRWVVSLLFDVAPMDPVTTAVTCLLLALSAGIACYSPARRAMRVNPIEALRAE